MPWPRPSSFSLAPRRLSMRWKMRKITKNMYSLKILFTRKQRKGNERNTEPACSKMVKPEGRPGSTLFQTTETAQSGGGDEVVELYQYFRKSNNIKYNIEIGLRKNGLISWSYQSDMSGPAERGHRPYDPSRRPNLDWSSTARNTHTRATRQEELDSI